jgi:8-oxo-dGTP pyrophosphatase MutT (NUDIX family)
MAESAESTVTQGPVEPKAAASVVLVRPAAPGAPEPIEAYMIRRNKGMKFLGGYYAFPGGKVDPEDGAPEALARCRGLAPAAAEAIFPGDAGGPALAFWVTAVRELLEESGILLGCDAGGRPVRADDPGVTAAIERCRKALMAGEAPFAALVAREGWALDLSRLRYLSHFITPRSSPIRFTARFFLCPVPPDQAPRLFTEETSEGFWIHPGEGYRRFLADELAMAEPAEYGLAYLAQFSSLDDLWAAHADGRHKFHGIIDRIDVFWDSFDWKQNRFRDLR